MELQLGQSRSGLLGKGLGNASGVSPRTAPRMAPEMKAQGSHCDLGPLVDGMFVDVKTKVDGELLRGSPFCLLALKAGLQPAPTSPRSADAVVRRPGSTCVL